MGKKKATSTSTAPMTPDRFWAERFEVKDARRRPPRWLSMRRAVALIANLENTDTATAKRLLIEALQEGRLTAWSFFHEYGDELGDAVSLREWRRLRNVENWFQECEISVGDIFHLWGSTSAPPPPSPEFRALLAVADALERLFIVNRSTAEAVLAEHERAELDRRLAEQEREKVKAEERADRWRRTGLAGRTPGGSKECILEELARRAESGALEATAAEQARALLTWHERDPQHKNCRKLGHPSAVTYILGPFKDAKRARGGSRPTKSTRS